MSRTVPPGVVVHYPCSDDQPMAESEFQLVPMLYALTVLRAERWRRASRLPTCSRVLLISEEGA
jgi:hypothetical protein